MKYGMSVLASPDSPLAPSGGQNGGGTPQEAADPRAVLRAMVAQREDAPAPETNSSQPAAAEATPEDSTEQVTTEENAGETDLTSPETAESQDETPAENEVESGDEASDDSESENAAAPQEWQRLSETERKSALELAKQLKPGEIPRIAKLVAQKHQAEQTIESLHQQLEELQAKASEAPAAASNATPLPETVAKLKTVQEVQGRLEKVQADVDALTDFLDARPGDLDTEYQVGEQTFTRQQLIDRRAALRAEAKALPKRGEQIAQAIQFDAARKEASRKTLTEFPQLSDPDHPDTKVARQLLKLPQFANEVNGEYLALAFAVGDRQLKEDAAKRKGGAAKPVATKPKGSVPLGKPHSANGSSGTKAAGQTIAAAMKRVQTEKSRDSFANLLAASGR